VNGVLVGEAATDAGQRSRIGRRLRAAREAQLLTLAELAAQCGLTKGFLSKVERDQAAPSVASLLRLCDALGLSIGELFDDAQDHDLVRDGEYPPINFGGEGMRESLLTPTRERRLQVIHSEIDPGGGSGDTFSPGAPHTFRNPSADAVARVLWVISPALSASGSRSNPA
jgi:transcriptional regulator with XRE-family HTH domain